MVFCNTCYKKLFGPRGCGHGNSLIAPPGIAEGEQPLSRTCTPRSTTPYTMSSSAPKFVYNLHVQGFITTSKSLGVLHVSMLCLLLSVCMLVLSSGTRLVWLASPALDFWTQPHSMMLGMGWQSSAISATSWPPRSRQRGLGTQELKKKQGAESYNSSNISFK